MTPTQPSLDPVLFYPSLRLHAREIEELVNKRRTQMCLRHIEAAGVNGPREHLNQMLASFYQQAKLEIHVNSAMLKAIAEDDNLQGTTFSSVANFGLELHEPLYGSVRTVEARKPFRLLLAAHVAAEAGLFFPRFPLTYENAAEMLSEVSTYAGLGILAMAMRMNELPSTGQQVEMVILQDEHPLQLQRDLREVSLPHGPQYDALMFALRRKGLSVVRIDAPR